MTGTTWPAPFSDEEVPSRLCQDPFETARKYRDEKRRNKKGALSGADSDGHAESAEQKKSVASPTTPFKHLPALPERLTLLGVMVDSTPYAEDRERRLRTRYAILSGLSRRGFTPLDNGHIGYLEPDCPDTHLPDIIPYEWFVSRDEKQVVLLYWLAEEYFIDDFRSKLTALQDTLNSHDVRKLPPISFVIIGPANSGTLLHWNKELCLALCRPNIDTKPLLPNNLAIYSPVATAVDSALLPHETCPSKDLKELWAKPLVGATLRRTIGTDLDLADAILGELKRRGVDPTKSAAWPSRVFGAALRSPSKDPYRDHSQHIVLISDWDTVYGRSLSEAFLQSVMKPENQTGHGEEYCRPDSVSTDPSPCLPWIHRFSYMRGLDGQIPTKKKSSSDQPASRSALQARQNHQTSPLEESAMERPVGQSQLDYVRRLATRIERLDASLRKGYLGRVRAIGVLGSDVYDKLLILQALRERFPDTLFFTTDLDARYMHPKEYPHTRNLIIASNFGLQLAPDCYVFA